MAVRRSYEEGCATAHALDLIGERWALLVVRELLFGPKRFTDLGARLIGASTSVLTQRLRELVDAGVLIRRKLPPPAGSWVYELTDWGRELEPIIRALGMWGARSTRFDYELPVTPASIALALKGFADPAKVRDLVGVVELRLDDETFHVTQRDGQFVVTGPSGQPVQATITAAAGDLRPFLHGRAPTAKALKDLGVQVDGDRAVATTLLAAVSKGSP